MSVWLSVTDKHSPYYDEYRLRLNFDKRQHTKHFSFIFEGVHVGCTPHVGAQPGCGFVQAHKDIPVRADRQTDGQMDRQTDGQMD